MLYDILNLNPTSFDEKNEMFVATSANPSPGAARNTTNISIDSIRNPSPKSKTSGEKISGQKSLALDDSSYLSLAEKFRAGSATEAETEQLQKAVEEAAKKENKCEYCVKCIENTGNCCSFR